MGTQFMLEDRCLTVAALKIRERFPRLANLANALPLLQSRDPKEAVQPSASQWQMPVTVLFQYKYSLDRMLSLAATVIPW